MLNSQPVLLTTDFQIQLCIQRSIPLTVEVISQTLENQCAQVIKRHQLNLSYTNEDLASDLLVLFQKINAYSELTQNLLCDYLPCKKLGKVLKIVNRCCEKIFRFFKTHMKQKKNYTEQRLKTLQSKFSSQAPGKCNRCRKFILSRDIEQTKVLITAGQFSDPYDLYDVGSSDFVNIRNKEDDEEYRIRFAEVWENKKKIEEKFHMMQLEFDKRAYGSSYSVGEIQKIEDVVKSIILEISENVNLNLELDNKTFNESMVNLINNIYKKIREHRIRENTKEEGIQVGEAQKIQMLSQMKQIHQKLTKKNKELSKKLSMKQKQMADLNKQIEKFETELNRCNLQKSSYEVAMKNLMNKQIEYENQIFTATSEGKSYLKKAQELQKQNQNLRAQIKKIYGYLESKKVSKKKEMKSALKSTKSISSKKKLKGSKIESNEHQGQIVERNMSRRQSKRISGVVEGFKRRSLSNHSSESQQYKGQQKNQVSFAETKKADRERQDIRDSDKVSNELAQIQEQPSLSVGRRLQDDDDDIGKSQISIEIRKTEKNLQFFKSTSSKRLKNNIMSLKRIKNPSIKQTVPDVDNQKQKIEKVEPQPEQDSEVKDNQQSQANSPKKSQQKHKVNFKGSLDKKNASFKRLINNKNKISEHESQNELETSGRLVKTKKTPSKFQSLHTSKSFQKPLQQNETSNKNQNQPRFRKTEIKKQSFQAGLLNQRKTSNLTSYVLSNTPQQKGQNKTEEAILSTLPYIFHSQKSEKLKVVNQNKYAQSYAELYELYKALVDEEIKQGSSVVKRSYEQFKKCLEHFIKFFAREHHSELEIKPYYLPSHAQQVSLNEINMNKIKKSHKHESMHSTSTYKQSTSSVRQWKNKFESWNWTGDNSIKSKWARKHANMSQFNNTYTCEQTKKQNDLSTLDLAEIKGKIGKMYFSSEEAYQLQKSHPASLSTNLNFTLSNFKNPKSGGQAQVELANILSKCEIKYLKVTIILLAKLHDKNIQIYETVKKSIMFPYSFLGQGMIMPSIQLKKQRKQRKTAGPGATTEITPQKQNLPIINDSAMISQAIIKLICLHRKCYQPRKESQILDNKKQRKESYSIHNNLSHEKNVCRHLIQFQKEIQREFGEEGDGKSARFNCADMGATLS